MAEDKSSWRGRAVHRRNERQTKLPDIRPPSASKKDTKKWCRGKVGKPHKPVCVDYAAHKNASWPRDGWKILVCSECKKELDHWWPPIFSFEKPRQPPDWVR
jgi:hypothetical protein